MLRAGLLAEATGASGRKAGSQGEGRTTQVDWQWEKGQWLPQSQARDTVSPLLLLPQQWFQSSFGPLRTAGAAMDRPEARKQGYRGRYRGHIVLPSSHQKRVSPPAAGG